MSVEYGSRNGPAVYVVVQQHRQHHRSGTVRRLLERAHRTVRGVCPPSPFCAALRGADRGPFGPSGPAPHHQPRGEALKKRETQIPMPAVPVPAPPDRPGRGLAPDPLRSRVGPSSGLTAQFQTILGITRIRL